MIYWNYFDQKTSQINWKFCLKLNEKFRINVQSEFLGGYCFVQLLKIDF
jgi:hypothetical protein